MGSEIVPNSFPGLFIGYTVFWLIIGIYFLRLRARVQTLEKECQQQK